MQALLAFLLYFAILVFIGFLSYRKNQTSDDFMLGSRGMNFYFTAFAAHASDMSSWLFLAYPAAIFTHGISATSIGLGLCIFMFINWHFIAPKLRVETEKYNSLTLSSYFESRFKDTSGSIRIISSLVSFIFFTVYISGGLVSLGLLLNTVFAIPYTLGVLLGTMIIIPYLFIGGYVTLAWTDCFQGLFLLTVIIIIPLSAFFLLGVAFNDILIPSTLVRSVKGGGIFYSFIEMLSWGLPYFGLPHILTKFMGISDVKEMYKAKWVGISWQATALIGATFIGLIGAVLYKSGSINPEFIFIFMTTSMFPLFLSTFILCAILGATITCMDSQILVVATSLAEDLYKKLFKKNATSKELVLVTRISIFIVAFISCLIAIWFKGSIMSLVSYAWFGLGASFAPVVLCSLYSKYTTKAGVIAGLITGCTSAVIWPFLPLPFEIPSMVPCFLLSLIAIRIFSNKFFLKATKL